MDFFKYHTSEQVGRNAILLVLLLTVIILGAGIIQSLSEMSIEKEQQTRLAAFNEVMFCHDYNRKLVYKCHVLDNGVVVIDQDRDGNNLVVDVIEKEMVDDKG